MVKIKRTICKNMYTTDPQKKISRVVKYLQSDLSVYTIEQVVQKLKDKFNVGVFVNYARILSQAHELEIYRSFKGQWISLLCKIEVAVDKFKPSVPDW